MEQKLVDRHRDEEEKDEEVRIAFNLNDDRVGDDGDGYGGNTTRKRVKRYSCNGQLLLYVFVCILPVKL